jgi:hypothetical protein
MVEFFRTFIQILALIAIPVAALQAALLWSMLWTGRFTYVPLRGEHLPTTRAEKPGWYWLAVATTLLSLVVKVALIGFVGFWTFYPR